MLVLQLAVCGSGSAAPIPTGAPLPGPAGSAAPSAARSTEPAPALLLEVASEGGFINPSANIGALPMVVVDSDGRGCGRCSPTSSAADRPRPSIVDVKTLIAPTGTRQ
jgi:hypothetical protein